MVCRDLGYNSASIVCCNVYGTNYHKIFVTDVTCTGNESTFSNCSYNIDGDCDMDNYAAVACYNKQDENSKSRNLCMLLVTLRINYMTITQLQMVIRQ